MRFRRENRSDDNARTIRLLDQSDAAFEREPANRLEADFSSALVNGLATDKAAEAAGNYPPAGHGYPRKD